MISDVIVFSSEIIDFFGEVCLLCPCFPCICYDEMILYLLITDTHLQTLFNILNITKNLK